MTTLRVHRAAGTIDQFEVFAFEEAPFRIDAGGVLVFTEVVGAIDSEGASRIRYRAISPHGPRGWVEVTT